MNNYRIKNLLQEIISSLKLDLSGLTVLTEAATGYYALTPIIAALAGAETVYCLARNSKFGTVKDVIELNTVLRRDLEVKNDVNIFTDRKDSRIGLADIVTNLGFVRPIDKAFLTQLKSTAVIPLMFETWEYRTADLDLSECRSLGIPVLGTNENHPVLLIFHYIGHLALKLLLTMDIELFKSKIVVIGGGEFGRHIVEVLRSIGAVVEQIQAERDKHRHHRRMEMFADCDAVIIANHHNHQPLIGHNGLFSPAELHKINPGLSFVHISGYVDRKALIEFGFRCVPDHFAQPGYMSVTTDELGPRPLIELHSAGLKVGEMMARESLSGRRGLEVELSVLDTSDLAQGFDGFHR